MTTEQPFTEQRTLEILVDGAREQLDDAKLHFDDMNYTDAILSCCSMFYIVSTQLKDKNPSRGLIHRVNECMSVIGTSLQQLVRTGLDQDEYWKILGALEFLDHPELLSTLGISRRIRSLVHVSFGDLCMKNHDYEGAQINYRASLNIKPSRGDSIRYRLRGRFIKSKKSDFNTRYKLGTAYLEDAEDTLDELNAQIQNQDPADAHMMFSEVEDKLNTAAKVFAKTMASDRRKKVRRDAKVQLGYVLLKQTELYSQFPLFLQGKHSRRRALGCAQRAESILLQESVLYARSRRHKRKRFGDNACLFDAFSHDDIDYYLGCLYLTGLVGNRRKAVASFLRVPEASVFFNDARLKLAIALSTKNGRPVYSRDAVKEYRGVLERDPGNLEALVGMGDMCRLDQSYVDAIGYYNAAHSLSDGNNKMKMRILIALADSYHNAGDLAIPMLKRYHYMTSANIMKLLFSRFGDAIHADKLMETCDAILDSPHSGFRERLDAMEIKERCLLMKNQLEDAIEVADHSIAIDPNNPAPHFSKGLLLYRLGQFKQAADSFWTSERLGFKDEDKHLQNLCMLGCSNMNLGKFKLGHKQIMNAVMRLYREKNIDERFKQADNPDHQILDLGIGDFFWFKVKKGHGVMEEFDKNLYIYQKLDKKSLISIPVARLAHNGEPHYVCLTLHGPSYADSLMFADDATVRRYAVKAMAILARLHHELNFSTNRSSKNAHKVFDKESTIQSVRQIWETAVFGAKRYEPLTEFTNLPRDHWTWQALWKKAGSLDDILYNPEIRNDVMMYGINQGDSHCGNLMDVSLYELDPKTSSEQGPYVSFKDNDQAHYDLFFSDLYDYLEDVRNGIDRTHINKHDLVRLYFLFRQALMQSKENYKEMLHCALNKDPAFRMWVDLFSVEQYVPLYQVYCVARDPKTFGMFKAYEHSRQKAPNKKLRSLYRHKASQMIRSCLGGFKYLEKSFGDPSYRVLRETWEQHLIAGKLKRYFTKFSRMPERSYDSSKPYESLFSAA